MRVRELMSGDVETVGPGHSCHDAIRAMTKNRLRHLPVVASHGSLAGMITDRDIRHYLLRPDVYARLGVADIPTLLGEVTVSEIMSWPPTTITADAEITEAAAVMRRAKIGSLLVVDGPQLAGIVTETDLLREILRANELCTADVEAIVVSYP